MKDLAITMVLFYLNEQYSTENLQERQEYRLQEKSHQQWSKLMRIAVDINGVVQLR